MRRLLFGAAVAVLAVLSAVVTTRASYEPPPGDFLPIWSPDARSVAYVSYREPAGLHVRDLATNLDRLYDEVGPVDADTWLSPDWQWVATIESTGAPPAAPVLVVQHLDGSERRVLSDAAFFPIAWSPDSKRIAFDRPTSSPRGTLSTIGVDGSGLTGIADASGLPAWSPNGKKIVYTQVTGPGQANIVIANAPDGSGARILTAALSGSPPSWSPDGSQIAVAAWADDRWNVDVVDVATGAARRFPAEFQSNEPNVLSWGSDSDKLIYSVAVTDPNAPTPPVYRIDVQSGRQEAIVSAGADASYSPDGTKIAFATIGDCSSTGLYVVDASGAHPTRLTNDCRHAVPSPQLSVAPRLATYGQSVTLSGWFPPGAATPLVRLVWFGSRACLATSTPVKTIVTSVAGTWSYRFRPCENGSFNIYSDTSETGATVRLKPFLRLRRVGHDTFEATARAGADLGGSTAVLEVRHGSTWTAIRKFPLLDRGPGFIAGRTFVLRRSVPARLRVVLPNPIVNGTILGAYAPATSNVVSTSR